ncbi:MAG TPA: response regulator [candidate division Zixibacteria bacterium]|nr:response regulator [candidate division Zixibacteria bacterium]
MSGPGQEMIELFLQEASEHLQFLREYSGILQDPYPLQDDVERLYISAHGLAGTAGTYGYKLFSDVASKLAHIFQYAMNATISPDATGPLVEFISEAVAVLESDLLMISQNSVEAEQDISAFKQRYPFAFQASPQAAECGQVSEPVPQGPTPLDPALVTEVISREADDEAAKLTDIEEDSELPLEVLEFFVPEVEEHLQVVTECLLALEANPNSEDINRLFRAMHTIKGSAAQVGMQRISHVAHKAEDLIGKLRDGELKPSVQIVDLCLESVDILKKLVYRQWTDDAAFQKAAKSLFVRIDRMAPAEKEAEAVVPEPRKEEAKPHPAAPPAAHPPQPPATQPGTVAGDDILDIDIEPVAPEPTPPHVAAPVAPRVPAATTPATPAVPSRVAPQAPKPVTPIPPAAPAPPAPAVAASTVPTAPKVAPPAKLGETPAVTPPAPETKEDEAEAAPRREAPASIAQSKSVRIALERLDRMMNAVGELVINRTRMLGRLTELEQLADVLNFSKGRMSDKVAEFQEKYEFSRINASITPQPSAPKLNAIAAGEFPFRGGYSSYARAFDPALAEFSELEMDRYDDFGILSRSLTEISADITEVLTQLDGFVRRVDSDIDEFTKLAHRLQDEITQARMVPIGNLYTRISRTVRDAAKAAGKQVELTLAGAETELDNNIIQQISDPLLHLVRNAVAHGIERSEERYMAGKSDVGNVAVRAYHRGNHIYIEVEDDGRGIDYARIRATAVETGFVSKEQAERLTESQMLDLLFRPGFSTAPRKTELAGRGVGLDVVRSNLNALNGEIEIETQKGIGSRFTLKVPLTLIISQALFVRCSEQMFAFPLGLVEEIRRIRENEIEEVGGKLMTKVRDVTTEIVRLDTQLGLPTIQPVGGWYRLVLVNVAGRQVGIVVEEVLRKDEIVIKSLGEYMRNVKMFPGATIAPDGSLILLVDINRLIMGEAIERRPLAVLGTAARLFAPGATAVAAGTIPAAAIEEVEKEKVVVLADDSISVRKFVGRMLEKAGYRVKLAADGLEALELATNFDCDLVITDLEMPRTNGYELMLHLRQNAKTAHLPVMVVTSRAGSKHRDRALKEGATAFMVKPVQEEQFVAQVQQLIGASGAVTAQ